MLHRLAGPTNQRPTLFHKNPWFAIDAARNTSGLVRRACSECGWVRVYLLVPLSGCLANILVNGPHGPPFNV